MSEARLVSVVVPVYYNEESLPHTWTELRGALSRLPAGVGWEVVFVDDGSGDRSFERLEECRAAEPDRVRIVRLTRNFGQVPAVLAGLLAAEGDACVLMSADLQDPSELILEMVDAWAEGDHKIVLVARGTREDGLVARTLSWLFYGLIRRVALPNMPQGGFDFLLVDRAVVDVLNTIREKNTFLQGRILWTGYEPLVLEGTRRRRVGGRSRWTFAKRVAYAVDALAYSVSPVRRSTLLSLVAAAFGVAFAVLLVVLELGFGRSVAAVVPAAVLSLLAGLQLLVLGIIGERVWRSYVETRRLPRFLVESTYGLGDGARTRLARELGGGGV